VLSYRHGFHAGNHADVLKHVVLARLLHHLAQKEKPFWYIDSHAGAGSYLLDRGYAAKNAEYADGVGRLWERTDVPESVADYLRLVRHLNPDGKLRRYPGSPLCALPLLREGDRMRLFELHGGDAAQLRHALAHDTRHIAIREEDGFAGLRALLPPPPRRALVLIDPSYEDKRDYARVLEALDDGLRRFATGIYALWYPQLRRPESRRLPERLKQHAGTHWLHVALTVRAPAKAGFGMHGSGLLIVNPPWSLAPALESVLPFLAAVLGQDEGAGFQLERSAP